MEAERCCTSSRARTQCTQNGDFLDCFHMQEERQIKPTGGSEVGECAGNGMCKRVILTCVTRPGSEQDR